MSGMVMLPVVTTSDTGLPDSVPYRALAMTHILAGPPRIRPAMGSREPEEEVAAARRVEDLPEQHEHEHVGTGHADRGAEDAVVGVDHAVKEDFHRGAAMSEIAGQVFAHEVIDDEHEDDPEQTRAHLVRRVTSSVSSTKVAVTAQSAGVRGSTPVQRVTSSAPFSTM